MKLTGSLLRDARERKNISLNEVSFATKINLKVLQSIEEGDLVHLPPKTFLRGFVKSYAEYLRLDIDHIMGQFQEEMGSTRPLVMETFPPKEEKTPLSLSATKAPAPTSRGSVTVDDMESPTISVTKILLGIVALTVVLVGIVAQRLIEKYQNEKSAAVEAPPTSTPQPTISPTGAANGSPTGGPTPESVKAASVPPPPSLAPTGLATKVAPTPSIKPSVAPSPAPNLVISVAPTAGPEPLPTPLKDPVPKAPAKISPTPSLPALTPSPLPVTPSPTPGTPIDPVAEEISAHVPAPTPTVAVAASTVAPQEIIVEALDSVTINFRIDGGRSQTLNLKPEQIHTFKGKQKVNLELSDGGAVNIIHNGQDRGVPGVLGSPSKLRYP